MKFRSVLRDSMPISEDRLHRFSLNRDKIRTKEIYDSIIYVYIYLKKNTFLKNK